MRSAHVRAYSQGNFAETADSGMGLKIYFCGSVSGGRQDQALHARLIEDLKQYGEVLTEAVGAENIEVENRLTDKEIHDTYVERLRTADALVAEVTQKSHGVGYELGRAIEMKKRILCLYRPSDGKKLSPMLAGAHNGDTFKVLYYNEEHEAMAEFKTFLGTPATPATLQTAGDGS